MNSYLLELDTRTFELEGAGECFYIATLTKQGPFFSVEVYNFTLDRPCKLWGKPGHEVGAYRTISRGAAYAMWERTLKVAA